MFYLRSISNFAYHEDDTATFTYFHLTTKDIMQFLLQVARCERPGRNISIRYKLFSAFDIWKIGINDLLQKHNNVLVGIARELYFFLKIIPRYLELVFNVLKTNWMKWKLGGSLTTLFDNNDKLDIFHALKLFNVID